MSSGWIASLRKHVSAVPLDPTADCAHPELVRATLVHQLSKNMPTVLLAISAIAVLVVWVMRDLAPTPQLFAWFFCVVALNLGRYLHLRSDSRRIGDLAPSHRSSVFLTAFAVASGVVWGMAAILFFPVDVVLYQVFLTFVLGGLIAGSAVGYAFWPPAYYAFAIPSLLPLTLQFMRQGNESSVVMGTMLVVYGVALSSFVRKSFSIQVTSVELQFEKDSLVDDLSKAKERYDLALEGSHDGIWDWDIERKEIHASPAFGEIMGVSIAGAPFPDSEFVKNIHDDDRVEFQRALDAHFDGKTEVLYAEFRVRGDANTTRWVLARGLALKDATGRVYRIAGSVTDITERRQAETALRDSQAQLRSIIENSPLLIAVRDVEGRFILANRAGYEAYGLTEKDVIGKTLHEVFPRELADAYLAHDREVLDTRSVIEKETRNLTARGMRSYLEAKFPILDAEGVPKGIGVISTDITERKIFETRTAETQKLEALGQLTGGVAHEFNNLLQAIVFSLESLKRHLPPSGEHTRKLEVATRAVTKGGELTQGLLSYLGKTVVVPKITKIDSLISETVELLRPMLGETVEIETALADDLWHTLVDRSQLQSAIINLAINARDAMLASGKLTIAVSNYSVDENFVPTHAAKLAPGDYVRVSVTDTGTGMPQSVVEHAFDPFFTTKEVAQGTGLGLSQVYGFVTRQSGGFVAIESDVGHGTTMTLYLPRAEVAVNDVTLAEDSKMQHAAGLGTVMVVEDDEMVRNATSMLVEEMGYTLFMAQDGTEALARLEGMDQVDLVLADVVLPGGLNGVALSSEIKRRYSGTRVILMTGYAHAELEMQGLLDDEIPQLQKPVTADELAKAIEQSLENQRD